MYSFLSIALNFNVFFKFKELFIFKDFINLKDVFL